MQTLEQANQCAADLHWLAFLLTGRCETGVDVVVETIASKDAPNFFFSAWMLAWSRRVFIAKALAAIRENLAASARRTESRRADQFALPARTWVLDQATTKLDLERALLAIDVFPRAAILLSVFERVPLKDAAILLDADAGLVCKAQMFGLRELTLNLARMQGWTPTATRSDVLTSEMQHA
jgi:DNA-directed RNA polymerase specialized sigma24 family protein